MVQTILAHHQINLSVENYVSLGVGHLFNVKNENILTPSKEIYNFELFQREFFNPPQKECTIFSSLLKQVFKIF